MPRKLDISLKKQPKQARAIATVDAIVEAATYILKRHGAAGFTANKVADKAGVNIASFYQYFPNKEALLFHVATLTWDRQLAQLAPVLARGGQDHAAKLREFIRMFFAVEAAEADLRRALRIAAVELKDTAQFRELMDEGAALTRTFIEDALRERAPGDLSFDVRFIVLLTTSFAERTTDEGTSDAELMRQADLLADMLIGHYGIA
ncbi:TetR/AcrR family transcriptional regulator [uncultured Massilia sp.]|uniref:TetR/AcrR family transcriptional regulator n=1 Tax=uncultured Massilia sp. TaxID=169973 RepID=UPI0025F94CFF|nr:TetR/AcrR family transcriptional regulator [uncultured Massilia sp.]